LNETSLVSDGNPDCMFDTARMPTVWWFRPVSRHARVGEHSGVTWKFVNRTPPAANRSALGVRSVEPKQFRWPKPRSS
jgi:hypothetical protein